MIKKQPTYTTFIEEGQTPNRRVKKDQENYLSTRIRSTSI